jgi:hypothetical protein
MQCIQDASVHVRFFALASHHAMVAAVTRTRFDQAGDLTRAARQSLSTVEVDESS